jgi:hypothetical protein
MRLAVSTIVVTDLLIIFLLFWNDMELYKKPGTRAAMERIRAERQSGEPVLVCSPLIYSTVLYYLGELADVRLWNASEEILHYQGSAIIRKEDLFLDEDFQSIRPGRVWVVNMGGGAFGSRAVPVPSEWIERERTWYPDVLYHGEIGVVLYEVPGSKARESLRGRTVRATTGRTTVLNGEPLACADSPEWP